MKVCYVLSTSEVTGGANRSLIDLLTAIDRNKVEPYVLMRKHGDMEHILNQLNIPFKIIPYLNAVSSGNKIKDWIKRIYEPVTVLWVKRFLVKQKIELVHNNSLTVLAGMEAAEILKIPYVCHIRENLKSGLGLNFLNESKHYSIMKKASCVLVISNFIGKEYKKDIPNLKYLVLQDGFYVSHYLDKRKKVFEKDTITIGMYGNLDPQKGQLDAIKAMELLQQRVFYNIHLEIIGNQNTHYAKLLRNYILTHRIKHIKLRNPIKNTGELKESREKTDINLICSRSEGLGRVTVESMLAGCITIGADAGATSEIIKDGYNGLLYQCKNAEDLANKIIWCFEHKKEARKIADTGRKNALEQYHINDYVYQILKIYRSLLPERNEMGIFFEKEITS